MDEWIDAVKRALGVDPEMNDEAILLIAREAAHLTERKAAPITTYLIGVAVAQGMTLADAVSKITALAEGRSPSV
jgi:hypothetical protein